MDVDVDVDVRSTVVDIIEGEFCLYIRQREDVPSTVVDIIVLWKIFDLECDTYGKEKGGAYYCT